MIDRTTRRFAATSLLAATTALVATASCAGILGLDETSLNGTPGDASTVDGPSGPAPSDDSSLPPEGSPSDDGSGGAGRTSDTGTASPDAAPPSDSGLPGFDAGPAPEAGPTGTVDTAFQGGFVLDTADPTGSIFNAVAIDASGRIVAGGMKASAGWLVRRFASDGTADTTFDTAIAIALPTTGALNGLVIDPTNGNIIATGTSGSTAQLTAIVFDQDGHAAGSFNGGTPLVLTSVVAPSGSVGYGVAMVGPQKFVVAGSSTNGLTSAYLSNPIGESDTPSAQGLGQNTDSPGNSSFHAVTSSAGAFVVAAGSVSAAGGETLLARFQAAGGLDTAFGDGGASVVGPSCVAQAIVALPRSGNLVIAGMDPISGTLNGCFGAWGTNGAMLYWKDGTAGGGGPFTYGGLAAMGDSEDRAYMVGSGGDSFGRRAELDRLLTTGSYDTTFAPGGTGQVVLGDTTSSPPSFYYTLKAVAVDVYGRIVIAGSKTASSTTSAVLGRFWP